MERKCDIKFSEVKINETQSANRVTVSVYLIHLNSRESPRLLWLSTAAPSSDVLGGSPVMHSGNIIMVHSTVKPVYSLGRPTVAVIKRWSANTGPNTCYGDYGAH